MRDCLLRKFRLDSLFEASHYAEVVFVNTAEDCAVTFHKHGTIWRVSGRTQDMNGLVEVESTSHSRHVFEFMASEEITGNAEDWFNSWFTSLYQEVSDGYVKRAIFESAPPTEFDSRWEERLLERSHLGVTQRLL